MKSWLIGKDPDAGKDWREEEKGVTENEMAGWHHQLNGHEFEQALRDGEGHGSLCAAIHGATKSQTRLSNWIVRTVSFSTMEKGWNIHSLKLSCLQSLQRYLNLYLNKFYLSSVQLLSHVRLFPTPWTAAHQASLSITNSQTLPKLMSIESVMPSNHLILCCPLFLLPSIYCCLISVYPGGKDI